MSDAIDPEMRAWIRETYGRIGALGRHASHDDEPTKTRPQGPVCGCGHREPRAPKDAMVVLCSTCLRQSLVVAQQPDPVISTSPEASEGADRVGIPGCPAPASADPHKQRRFAPGLYDAGTSGRRGGRPRIHVSGQAARAAASRAYRARQRAGLGPSRTRRVATV